MRRAATSFSLNTPSPSLSKCSKRRLRTWGTAAAAAAGGDTPVAAETAAAATGAVASCTAVAAAEAPGWVSTNGASCSLAARTKCAADRPVPPLTLPTADAPAIDAAPNVAPTDGKAFVLSSRATAEAANDLGGAKLERRVSSCTVVVCGLARAARRAALKKSPPARMEPDASHAERCQRRHLRGGAGPSWRVRGEEDEAATVVVAVAAAKRVEPPNSRIAMNGGGV